MEGSNFSLQKIISKKKNKLMNKKTTVGTSCFIFFLAIIFCFCCFILYLIYNKSSLIEFFTTSNEKLNSTLSSAKKSNENLTDAFLKLNQTVTELKLKNIKMHSRIKDLSEELEMLEAEVKKDKETYTQYQIDFDNQRHLRAKTKKMLKSYNYDVGILNAKIDLLKKEKNALTEKLAMLKDQGDSSDLLINDPKIWKIISQWIAAGYEVKFNLLYKGTKNGFSTETFHKLCGDFSIKSTLVVMKTTDSDIIGGFTKNNWLDDERYHDDAEAFLFNLNLLRRYPILKTKDAIYAGKAYFAVFGRSDLVIQSPNSCISIFPSSYSGGAQLELTNGKRNFQLKELEVFNVRIDYSKKVIE